MGLRGWRARGLLAAGPTEGESYVWILHAGVGRDNPNKDPLIGGFPLSEQDRKDLIDFLKSLTGEAVLTDPRFANPW